VTAQDAGEAMARIGSRFYSRNWVLGTSGNFSAVLSREPLQLLITRSSAHKGSLTADDFLLVDGAGDVINGGGGRPSAETTLHVAIANARGANAVLHTHSVWSTILSDRHAGDGGLAIHGYEMLKGLSGVTTHEHREWIPIVDNDQDMRRLRQSVGRALDDHPEAHAILLRAHGLYAWGATLTDAERHIEILEFLFETVGRAGANAQS
jgi:methylthioribulose-1-phosphate dehydratase